MKKKEPTDEELIEQFACKSVKVALPQGKARESRQLGLTWKEVWRRILGKYK
jgi:hypothetical protein